jgi:hypothetical protein
VILTEHHDQADVITHQTAGQEIERGLRSRLGYQIEVFLPVISTEKHIHPAHTALHDVMRKIWNDGNNYFCLLLVLNACFQSS